jgi:5-methylcytosine-specific restriction endonuclease McrA
MQCYKCDNCSKEYFRFSSQVRGQTKTCSRVCNQELSKKIGKFSGENNANYRHGNSCEPSYCECGKIKDHRAVLCAVCANKSVPIQKEYRKTDQEVIDAATQFNSYYEIAAEIGTSRSRVARILKENNVDISHFTPCNFRPTSFESVFRLRSEGHRSGLPRQVILRNSLLPYECSECRIPDEWNGNPLVLELDHINGNRLDDRIENLRFLCPNCHSQTSTYKGRNMGASNE